MADFEAHRRNFGTPETAHLRVWITLGNYGSSLDGTPKVIPECVTIQDLDEQIDQLKQSLDEAYQLAKSFLEENAENRIEE